MYLAWSERRRMRSETLLVADGDGRSPYSLLLAVSGYAAQAILEPEERLHLLELPDDEGKGFRRVIARVRVAAQPEIPSAESGGLLAQARAAFEDSASENLAIVRRYRESPAPLVRDNTVGWRTSRLERVLRGDFDLMAAIHLASTERT